MSRRRKRRFGGLTYVDGRGWRADFLRPVEAARAERVRRQALRVKRRAARRGVDR